MRRLTRTIDETGWSRDVPQLGPGEPVARALDTMRKAHDCVLVVEDGRLLGIFTSRDFLNRVAAVRGDPDALTLAEVMTPTPRTLRPRDGVAFAINWMSLEGFRNVPIVDDRGVQGVLTVWDVMARMLDIFAEIDATPREESPRDDAFIDLGGSS